MKNTDKIFLAKMEIKAHIRALKSWRQAHFNAFGSLPVNKEPARPAFARIAILRKKIREMKAAA